MQLIERGPACLVRLGYAKHVADVRVSHLPHGAYNRVLRLDVLRGARGSYVIRTPRRHHEETDRERYRENKLVIDCLHRALPDLPIGQVLFATPGSITLGAPFTLAPLMPGVRLADCLESLSTTQRLTLADQMAEIYAKIWSIELPACGPIRYDAATGSLGVGYDFHVRSLYLPFERQPNPDEDPLPDGAWGHLRERLAMLSDIPDLIQAHECRLRLDLIVAELETENRWTNRIVLSHKDLFPRVRAIQRTLSSGKQSRKEKADVCIQNLLIDDPRSPKPRITAVLDWDLARGSPPEVAYVLPSWLWNKSSHPHWDHHLASEKFNVFEGEPLDLQYVLVHKKVKKRFLERMTELCPDFKSVYAEGQRCRARSLFFVVQWPANFRPQKVIDRLAEYHQWWYEQQSLQQQQQHEALVRREGLLPRVVVKLWRKSREVARRLRRL